MALNTGPFGTYTDVSGVVDGTAATEIVALVTSLLTLIPDTPVAYAAGAGTPAGESEQEIPSPEFDKMPLDLATRLRVEIDALAAAIAAAPTS